jgi:hypothetical protein
MYRYKIGYTSYEESSFVELEHEQKYTHQELSEIIANATVEVVKVLKKIPNSYTHSFQDVFEGLYSECNVISYLIANKGFKRIEYQDVWSVFGWASIFDKTDWGSENRDWELDFIVEKILEAGFTKEDDRHLNWNPGEKDENKSE